MSNDSNVIFEFKNFDREIAVVNRSSSLSIAVEDTLNDRLVYIVLYPDEIAKLAASLNTWLNPTWLQPPSEDDE